MRVLLDTHAMYWYIEGDTQLSAAAQTLIQDTSNEVLVSPASYWEIAIKVSLGKWKLNRASSIPPGWRRHQSVVVVEHDAGAIQSLLPRARCAARLRSRRWVFVRRWS